jgi:hypothetical protein
MTRICAAATGDPTRFPQCVTAALQRILVMLNRILFWRARSRSCGANLPVRSRRLLPAYDPDFARHR